MAACTSAALVLRDNGRYLGSMGTSIRYGVIGGLLAAVMLLVAIDPASMFEAKLWNLPVACGFAAMLGLAVNLALARARGFARLPATFFHASHVYLGRIAAAFAVAHTVWLIALEPTLLSDLRLGGALSTWAGGGSLVALLLLGTIPWRDCRSIHERRPNFVHHAILATLALGLALLHIFAKDYHNADWRIWIWLLLPAAAVGAVAFRYLGKPGPAGKPIPRQDARQARTLARNALSIATLTAILVLSTYVLLR